MARACRLARQPSLPEEPGLMLARPKVSIRLTRSTTSQWLDGMLTSRSHPRFAAIELHDHYRLGATPSSWPQGQ
jgi:hypothetical protein